MTVAHIVAADSSCRVYATHDVSVAGVAPPRSERPHTFFKQRYIVSILAVLLAGKERYIVLARSVSLVAVVRSKV